MSHVVHKPIKLFQHIYKKKEPSGNIQGTLNYTTNEFTDKQN